jgi:tetratricopeptide (TPR) repeat protein
LDGEADVVSGKLVRAEERFAVAVAKGGPPVNGDVAAIFRRHDRDAAAEKQLRAWVAASPEDADARLALGAILDRTGQFALAEVELRQAMRLDPTSAEAFNSWATASRIAASGSEAGPRRKALAIDLERGSGLLGWTFVKLNASKTPGSGSRGEEFARSDGARASAISDAPASARAKTF